MRGAVEFTGIGTGPVVTLTAATTATFTTVNLPGHRAQPPKTLDFPCPPTLVREHSRSGAITVGAAPFSRVAGTFPGGLPRNCGGTVAMGAGLHHPRQVSCRRPPVPSPDRLR